MSRTAFSFGIAISIGLRIGPPAWSSIVAARPSQNWAMWPAALSTVGALRPPFCFLWPVLVGSPSTPCLSMAWQLAHDTSWFFERRASK